MLYTSFLRVFIKFDVISFLSLRNVPVDVTLCFCCKCLISGALVNKLSNGMFLLLLEIACTNLPTTSKVRSFAKMGHQAVYRDKFQGSQYKSSASTKAYIDEPKTYRPMLPTFRRYSLGV